MAFGERDALFNEPAQQLAELNTTASFIWRSFQEGLTAKEVEGQLRAGDLDPLVASRFVSDAMTNWLSTGWVEPLGLSEVLNAEPSISLSLSILGVGFLVKLYGGAAVDGLMDFLVPLRGEAGADPLELCVAAFGEGFLVLLGDRTQGWFADDHLVPAVKALLTARMAEAVDSGFLAHGALLDRGERRIFLSGSPGMGKSTLAVALIGSGFECRADDIVHVDRQGRMSGAPFSVTIKSGAWALLDCASARAGALKVHVRQDAQQVRYLTDAVSNGGSRRADIVINLMRTARGPPALEPLDPLDAAKIILESAYAASGRIDLTQMKTLALQCSASRNYTLTYSDAKSAAPMVADLVV